MNLQQLRFVREAVRRDFNLTEVGNALYLSQSGISKRIRELELELGVDIFVRKGRRLIGLTPAGQVVASAAEQILQDIEGLVEQLAFASQISNVTPEGNPMATSAFG